MPPYQVDLWLRCSFMVFLKTVSLCSFFFSCFMPGLSDFQVHQALGKGAFASVYKVSMCYMLILHVYGSCRCPKQRHNE